MTAKNTKYAKDTKATKNCVDRAVPLPQSEFPIPRESVTSGSVLDLDLGSGYLSIPHHLQQVQAIGQVRHIQCTTGYAHGPA